MIILLIFLASIRTCLMWRQDDYLRSIVPTTCDIQEFRSIDELQSSTNHCQWSDSNKPFIIRGLAKQWKAVETWQKHNFLQKYGDRILKYGSEHSIVYGGGSAELTTTVAEYLRMMDANSGFSDNKSTKFVFQPSIMEEIPQLRNDFEIPRIFDTWDTAEREQSGDMWHMLSLGSSRKGLPFHNHGKTWLAVIHGAKLWFLYPLGFGPHAVHHRDKSPFTWFQDIYPTLLSTNAAAVVPPQINQKYAYDDGETCPLPNSDTLHSTIYRPLTCLQEAGDVMFLPAQWLHMTLNVGDCIAVGGQELLQDEERLANAKKAYNFHPLDQFVLKDYGLALMNIAGAMQERLNVLTSQYFNLSCNEHDDKHCRLLHVHNHNDTLILIEKYQAVSNDSFLIISVKTSQTDVDITRNNFPCSMSMVASLKYMNTSILQLHSRLMQLIDVNIVFQNQSSAKDNENNHDDHKNDHHDEWQTTVDLVDICFLPGSAIDHLNHSTQHDANIYLHDIDLNLDQSRLQTRNKSESEVVSLLQSFMQKNKLSPGSIHTSPTSVTAMYHAAEHFLLQSLDVNADQPELISILSEMYLRNHETIKLLHLLEKADNQYSKWATMKTYSPTTLSSLFHKLGSFASSAQRYHYASSLLMKSIQSFRLFLPAWYDLVLVQKAKGVQANVDTILGEMELLFVTEREKVIMHELRDDSNTVV